MNASIDRAPDPSVHPGPGQLLRPDSDRSGESTDGAVTQALEQDWWRPLVGTGLFLGVPALLILLPKIAGAGTPVSVLYLVAGVAGLVLALRSMSNPEWLLATVILYLPLSKTDVAPLAPGINGTNVLEVLLLMAWAFQSRRTALTRDPSQPPLPFTRLVMWWAVLSFGSMITAMVNYGPWFITADKLPRVKAWLDQFIVFFAVLALVRDSGRAKRVAVYMAVGLTIVVMFSFNEWLEKRWYDRIEKARLLGPHQQPNDLGAFIVYAFGIPGAWVLFRMWRLRTWLIATPVLYMAARVLLATFSRGAVLGMGALTAMLLLLRGRILAAVLAASAALVVQVAPELLPESLTARMSQTQDEDSGELDKSSQTRIILWNAAWKIMKDYPVTGAGFMTFPVLKDSYAELPTLESDNHNMYFYIGSQMGLPALAVFVALLLGMAYTGARLYWKSPDEGIRIIGLGCAASAAGCAAINVFGSRMVDIGVSAYVWIMLAMLARLWALHLDGERAKAAQPAPSNALNAADTAARSSAPRS